MDCNPPGSSVPGILQARILEWVAIPFSRGSFWPRDQTQVSCIAGGFFTIWATREGLAQHNQAYTNWIEGKKGTGAWIPSKAFCVSVEKRIPYLVNDK